MSMFHSPDVINSPELQVWNNGAFDNGESEESIGIKSSWWNKSLESSCSKENRSPVFEKSPVSFKSSLPSVPIKPLSSNSIIANSGGNPLKLLSIPGTASNNCILKKDKSCDERKIDTEIEEIEKEIRCLSLRLEALRLEKAERSPKTERRGRIVPAKFMEPKQTVGIEESLLSSCETKINRRGISMGPSEIFSGAKSWWLSKQEITPVSTQSRRKSCYWNLEEIDELKATKERGKSLSVSPISRKTTSKIQVSKLAATTVGSKKSVKKEDGFLALIQPKKLFRDGQKSVPNKKPVVKAGRVVPSRYNQFEANQCMGNLNSSEAGKRSLPNSDEEDDNKRIESSRVKKKWEIPSEVVIYKSDTVPSLESPRESGAAKRVADLVGRKSFFCTDEEEIDRDPVCQTLSFEEEENRKEKENVKKV